MVILAIEGILNHQNAQNDTQIKQLIIPIGNIGIEQVINTQKHQDNSQAIASS